MALMPANAQQLIETIKTAPRVLKIIAAIVAVDVVVLLYAALSLEGDVDALVDRISTLQGQLAAQKQTVEATRKEINHLPDLRRLYDAAMSSGVLADQDRLKLVTLAQDLANQHRLIDLHYRLAPEEVTSLTGSKYRLVSTEVALTDGAVLDSDVFEFWKEILDKSPAHYQVTKLSLERLDTDLNAVVASIRAGHPISMAKAELDFRWISLRAPLDASKPLGGVAAPAPGTTASASVSPAPAGATK